MQIFRFISSLIGQKEGIYGRKKVERRFVPSLDPVGFSTQILVILQVFKLP